MQNHPAVDNRRPGAYNDSHIHSRGAASHAQFVFQPQKRQHRDHVRGGFACSDANTNNNSVLLLTIDTVLAVSIFVILGILGITPPTGHAKPVFAG